MCGWCGCGCLPLRRGLLLLTLLLLPGVASSGRRHTMASARQVQKSTGEGVQEVKEDVCARCVMLEVGCHLYKV